MEIKTKERMLGLLIIRLDFEEFSKRFQLVQKDLCLKRVQSLSDNESFLRMELSKNKPILKHFAHLKYIYGLRANLFTVLSLMCLQIDFIQMNMYGLYYRDSTYLNSPDDIRDQSMILPLSITQNCI
ncbi:hypothetical protein GQX74_002286 [Glossina fuscipes]|nr:hypothetical protein GQX74_002286 [Glossina fuscipes]